MATCDANLVCIHQVFSYLNKNNNMCILIKWLTEKKENYYFYN